MDSETLTFLLSGGHLNMEERSARGIWPHPPIAYSVVQTHLVQIIQNREWFPCDLSEGRDGVIIQNCGNTFVCHLLDYSYMGAPIISSQSQQLFITPEEAADYYLKRGLRLPGDLDGWKVV
ncbi:MAG: hypothetical protein P1V19_24700 [Gimesia sp.]|nr:hypothetical protein [Gimesia sp.]